MFFLSCVCYAFVSVWLYVPCGHLLGKGWPPGSRLWWPTVFLSLSHWYPGSGVVLHCIDFRSLHPYLLWYFTPQSKYVQLCQDGSSLVEPVLSNDQCVFLKNTTQWHWSGSYKQSISLESRLYHMALNTAQFMRRNIILKNTGLLNEVWKI